MPYAKRFGASLLIFMILNGLIGLKPAGIALAAAPTATVEVDDELLTIGESTLVTITFSEAVTGFTIANLIVENGTIGELRTADNTTYTAKFTPTTGIEDSTNVVKLNNTGIINESMEAGVGFTTSNNFAIDTKQPTSNSIAISSASLKAGETANVTFTFSEKVTGFTNDDLTVPNGTLTDVSSSDGGISWTATFTPADNINDSTNYIILGNTGLTDLAGNPGTGTLSSANFAIHTVRPTATITVVDSSLTIGETSPVTIAFSEAVTGFDNNDLTVSNGTLGPAITSDGGKTWKATLAPTPNMEAPTNVIELDNSGVTNATGNAGAGTTVSNNYAIDTKRPTAAIVVADASLTVGETSLVTFTFSEKVTGFANDDLSVSNGTLSAVSSSDGGITWTATFTPADNTNASANLITLHNSGITDLSGNSGTGTTSSNPFIIATTQPTAAIAVADSSLTVGETSLVTITFSEAVTGFTNDDLTIANGTLSPVSSSDGGITWTATFAPAADIEAPTNVISLDNTGVANASGNAGAGVTASNNYAIDTKRPTAAIAVADDSLTIGETSLVTIAFSEAVTGFANDDLTIPNGTLSPVSSSDGGMTWTATLTPTADIEDTTNVISLDNARVTDLAGNAGAGSVHSNNYATDTKRPTAAVFVADASLTAGGTTLVTFTFSEKVTGFANDDLTIPNGTLSAVGSSDGGLTWTATFAPTADIRAAANSITLDNSGVTDLSGNPGMGTTNSGNFTIDTVRPTAAIAVADSALTVGETTLVTITFSEAVTGFANDDLTISNGTLSPVSSSDGGITWKATFTPKADMEAPANVISLDNAGIANASGNAGTGVTASNSYAIDTKRPTAAIAVADSSLTAGETSLVTFTFSEKVTGFANDDLTIPSGTLSPVSSSDGGLTWTATFTPKANTRAATNTIALDNSGVTDLAGNPGQGTTHSNVYSVMTARATSSSSNDGPILSTDGRLTLPAGRAGRVSLGEEVSVYVPAGATNKELTITIVKVQDVQKLLSDEFILKSSIYEIQKNIPENFLIPVTITFVFDPASLKSDQRAAIFYYDESKKAWVEVGGTVGDRHIAAQTDHFTKFAVFAVNPPSVDKPSEGEATFSDISGHWAENAIRQAMGSGIVDGYPDGTFKPNRTVTRAEFAVMLMNALKPSAEGTDLKFADAATIPSWARQAVAQAVQAGIVNGYDDGSFRPDAEIARSEMAAMIAKALQLTGDPKASSGFADDRSIPSWARGAAAALKEFGIMGGSGANLFNGSSKTTRAEAVTVLLRMLAQMDKSTSA